MRRANQNHTTQKFGKLGTQPVILTGLSRSPPPNACSHFLVHPRRKSNRNTVSQRRHSYRGRPGSSRVNINYLAFSHYGTGTYDGQVFAIFVIALAAAEAAIGLAIVLGIYQTFQTIDVEATETLRG